MRAATRKPWHWAKRKIMPPVHIQYRRASMLMKRQAKADQPAGFTPFLGLNRAERRRRDAIERAAKRKRS